MNDAVAAALVALRRDGPVSDKQFDLRLDLFGSYLARSHNGSAALLIPVSGSAKGPGRTSAAIRLTFHEAITFRLEHGSFDAAAAVLECLDDGLLETFCVVSLDLARRFQASSNRPPVRDVMDRLSEWEHLFRLPGRLAPEAEVGLWGEILFILSLPNADQAVSAWRGPERDVADFFSNHVGFECKTTLQRLHHQISQRQVDRPKGDHTVYVVSQWIGVDPGRGRSLPELVDELTERVDDRAALEHQLLTAGYDRRQSNSYTRRFAALEPMMIFGHDAIPRVTAHDPGIQSIRYEFTFDEVRALPPANISSLIEQFVLRPSQDRQPPGAQ